MSIYSIFQNHQLHHSLRGQEQVMAQLRRDSSALMTWQRTHTVTTQQLDAHLKAWQYEVTSVLQHTAQATTLPHQLSTVIASLRRDFDTLNEWQRTHIVTTQWLNEHLADWQQQNTVKLQELLTAVAPLSQDINAFSMKQQAQAIAAENQINEQMAALRRHVSTTLQQCIPRPQISHGEGARATMKKQIIGWPYSSAP
jgi:hypothetical protein